MEKLFLLYDFDTGEVVGIQSIYMVKKKRNHSGNLVDSYVMLPPVAVVWITLETFQTLVDAESQAMD